MSDIVDELESIVRDQRWDDLAAVIDDRFFLYLMTEPTAIRRSLDAVSDEWLRAHPRYLMARSIARGPLGPLGLMNDAESAVFSEWVESQQTPATRDVLGVRQGQLRRLLASGRVDDANRAADEILEIVDRAPDSGGFHDVLPPVLLRAGLAKLLSGHPSGAINTFWEARRWARTRPGNPYERYAWGYLAVTYALAGSYARAESALARVASAPDPGDGSGIHNEIVEVFAQALIAVGRLDEHSTRELLAITETMPEVEELWWIDVHLRARYGLYWGDRESMIHELENDLVSHGHLARPGSMAGGRLRADLADLYQAVGNLGAAEHVLSLAGIDGGHPSVLTSRARLRVLRGDHEGALGRLSAAEQSTGGRVQFGPTWRMLQASAEHAIGEDSAAETLRHSVVALKHDRAFDALVEATPQVRRDAVELLHEDVPQLPEVFPVPNRADLTAREREVLAALRRHSSVKALAAALHVSPNTAKSHLRALYRKLAVHSREQALRATSGAKL